MAEATSQVLAHRHSLAFKMEEYPSCKSGTTLYATGSKEGPSRYHNYCCQKSDMYDVASDMQKINDGVRCSKFGVPTRSALFYRLNALPRVLGGWLPGVLIHFELSPWHPIPPQVLHPLSSPGQRGSPSAPQRSVWCFLPAGSRCGVRPGWPASTWRRRCRFGPGGRRCCRRRCG